MCGNFRENNGQNCSFLKVRQFVVSIRPLWTWSVVDLFLVYLRKTNSQSVKWQWMATTLSLCFTYNTAVSSVVEKKQPVTQWRSLIIQFVTLVWPWIIDGAGNMAGRYAGALILIQRHFPKFILLLDTFSLVETSHTNCWIHRCQYSS